MKLDSTTGPWRVEKSGHRDFDYCIVAPDGGSICHITRWFGANADTQLMAAAPEMLDVLLRLVNYYKSDTTPEAVFKLNKAKKIIEKATGKSIEEVMK